MFPFPSTCAYMLYILPLSEISMPGLRGRLSIQMQPQGGQFVDQAPTTTLFHITQLYVGTSEGAELK